MTARIAFAFAATAALITSACSSATSPATSSPATKSAAPTVAASASASPHSAAAAVGQTSTKLAEGTLPALPNGSLYINFLDVPQPPASPLTHTHVGGFVYSVAGTHQMAIAGGETKNIKPGEAAFISSDVAHTHSNPGSTPNTWYFAALRPNGGRTAAPLFPGQTVLFASPDLPQLTPGKYLEQLNLVTLEKGGRTAAHKHGGIEVVVVLEGTIEMRVAGATAATLVKGKGAYVPANTPLQATNTGDGPAKFLAFFVTLEGQPFSTNVDSVP